MIDVANGPTMQLSPEVHGIGVDQGAGGTGVSLRADIPLYPRHLRRHALG
jgi:hypothetical protein